MSERICLILTQYRKGSHYNDFIGKFYHFPATKSKNYLKQFDKLPIEVIYFEPEKKGEGVFYGYGKITKAPFPDNKDLGHYFVEISDYKLFSKPVYFKNEKGQILESLFNSNYYNYNNAVRKIDCKFLDELCLDGGIQLNFKADSHLVQVLGEQLIASERVGILELIKNAFDAEASYCKVWIEKVPSLPEIPESLYHFNEYEGPVIVIEDNGQGMTKEQIENGWLRPATTIKTNFKERLKKEKEKASEEKKLGTYKSLTRLLKAANKGRIPLGEKGVGRFASHRLGRNLIIKTKTVENNYEYVLQINWDDFNIIDGSFKDLDSVKVTLRRQPPTRDYGVRNSGTQLIIYGGREGFELTQEEIEQINRTILQLNSPNPNPDSDVDTSFLATFVCPQVKDLDEQINYLKYDPVFRINGFVNEWGEFKYNYTFAPPYNIPLEGFNLIDEIKDLKMSDNSYWIDREQNEITDGNKDTWRKPECGAFYFHLDVWYRDRPWINVLDQDFLNYLKDYGGISVYRDGINVFPSEWGTESDWLDLRQRQIQQAFRVSYYHMLGNIELNQLENIDIIDKTNREGMIKNRAFLDLRELVRAIVLFVENDYIGKRREYSRIAGGVLGDSRRLRSFSKQSAGIISNIANNYDLSLDQYNLFENINELSEETERKGHLIELSKSLKDLEGNLKQVQEIQDILTEQAGFGLGIAVALHEINKTVSNFYYSILEVIRKGEFDALKLEELKDTSRALESELLRLSPLRALRNEDPVLFKVSSCIKYIESVFKRRLLKLNISFSFNKDQDFTILAKYGALNQILTNLVDNSCYWLDNPRILDRRIEILINEQQRTIIVADSGPGIADSIMPYLFQPGNSLKYPPSGLGLYISKHYMNLMKKRGDIYLVREDERIPNLDGAQFLLDFSKVISNDE